jgi:hypothetical protein
LSESTAGPSAAAVSPPASLKALTKTLTASMASALVVDNVSQVVWTALVVIDAWRCDSRALELEADCEDDTDIEVR